MRPIPPALQAKLDSGVTTLARCWRIVRRDGVVLGFTDHDEDVVLGALTCKAGTGFSGSEATASFGLAVSGSEISGALSADALSDADLAAGRYDAAAIEVHLVDWSEPSLHVLLAKGVLGEVRREGQAFVAELRSLADRLNEESGRRYTATCSADLGDSRCLIDLTSSTFRGNATVTSLNGTSSFFASGLGAYANGTGPARLARRHCGGRRPDRCVLRHRCRLPLLPHGAALRRQPGRERGWRRCVPDRLGAARLTRVRSARVVGIRFQLGRDRRAQSGALSR